MVLERFSEDPSLVVELAAAALAAAASDGISTRDAVADAGDVGLAAGQPALELRGLLQAEELVLELVGDDRLVESVCEASQGSASGGSSAASPRCQLVALLWNHAVACLSGGRAFAAAEAFFGAVLPLLERAGDADGSCGQGSQGSGLPQAVVCCRSLALCCLGLGQHAR